MAQLYYCTLYEFRMMIPRLALSSSFLNQPAAIWLGYGTEAAVLCHKIEDRLSHEFWALHPRQVAGLFD